MLHANLTSLLSGVCACTAPRTAVTAWPTVAAADSSIGRPGCCWRPILSQCRVSVPGSLSTHCGSALGKPLMVLVRARAQTGTPPHHKSTQFLKDNPILFFPSPVYHRGCFASLSYSVLGLCVQTVWSWARTLELTAFGYYAFVCNRVCQGLQHDAGTYIIRQLQTLRETVDADLLLLQWHQRSARLQQRVLKQRPNM